MGCKMDDAPAPVELPQAAAIPNKLFFRMGEVARLVGVEPYVVRYWETEFPVLSPRKSSTGQRMFRRKDVELLLEIKRLLYDRKFTIEGARKALQQDKEKVKTRRAPVGGQNSLFFSASPLPAIRTELAEILKLLL